MQKRKRKRRKKIAKQKSEKQMTAKQKTEKQKMRLQMLLLQEGKRLVITSLGKEGSKRIYKLTASENGRSRLNGSSRNTAGSRSALTVAVGTDGAAAAGAGTVVAGRADLTLLTAAEVCSGVVASRTANGLSVGADGTSRLTSENGRSRVEGHGGGGRSQNEDSGESHDCDCNCREWVRKIGLN
jgi:hypothetical protein